MKDKVLLALQVNADRLKADFEALAAIGETIDGGVHRPAFSETHLAARAWFLRRAQESGLSTSVDGAGNHSAVLNCGAPGARTLLLGSHLDSVPYGGRFDGALGVLAALEALRIVQERGLQLPVHLEAIDFSDEEGTLVGLLGSRALAGELHAEDLVNPQGGRDALLEGLARAGLDEADLFGARRDPDRLAGYLELHIEQGPRLLEAGAQIGVVTTIVGISSYKLIFHGRADHAGTTPMGRRRDAAQGAAAFTLEARRLVVEAFPTCVVNVGWMDFIPGAFNIVPAQAALGLELRAPEAGLLDRLESASLARAQAEAERFDLTLQVERLGRLQPAPMSDQAQSAIRAAAKDLGLAYLPLPSGAGHDGQSLANLCPVGMLFIPSQDGASHSAREFSTWQDCVNGANVLLGAALRFAGYYI